MKLGFGALGVTCVLAAIAQAEPHKKLVAPFTATAQDLLALAAATPATDAPVVLLHRENKRTYDAQGRAVGSFRYVYVVKTQVGVDEWGTLSTMWRPFYQDKPVLRARVIEPSGKISDLEASLIHDAPAVSTSPTVYSDLRSMEAPLPRLQIGSVVEAEIVTTDRVPLLAAGTVDRFTYATSVPTDSTVLVISAPASLKAKVVARSITAKPRRTSANGIETWTYDHGKSMPDDDDESSLPSDVVEYPFVGIATGASWGAIARDYKKLVERRIAEGPVKLPPKLAGPTKMATVHAIVAWLHAQVRYTGIEFGQASITPWPPAETVKRGFGDCKDKATLLVALLRQAGFRADLALLSTGPGEDIDKELPGMGEFDHAIVRAIVDGRSVWIDATEDLHLAGTLPLRDQGRRALIVADDARELVLTPRSTSADSLVREVRTWQLSEFGAARVTEVSREGGMFDVENRTWIRDTRADDVRKSLVSYASTEYTGELESYVSTPPGDLATPFEMSVVVAKAARGWTNRAKIEVLLYPGDVLEKMPKDLQTYDEKDPPRRREFETWRPHRYEIEHRLIIPKGFTLPVPAPERKQVLATASFVEKQRLEGNTFIVTFTFDSGKARLKPAEVAALQKALSAFLKEERSIHIAQTGWSLAERGQYKQAIAEIEPLIKAHPREALHYTQLGHAYLSAGAGQAARRMARKAVELEPKNADVHAFLAWVLRHDSFGREYGFDHDRAGAIAAYRTAMKLDPKLTYVAVSLSEVLEVGPTGGSRGRDLPGAIEARAAAFALDASDEQALALARLHLLSNRGADAERLLRARDSSANRNALLVAAIALQRGGPAAVSEAAQMRSGTTSLLDTAGATLLQLRAYDAARAMFAASGSHPPGSVQATMFKSAAKRPDRIDRSDPRNAVREMFASLADEQPAQIYWDDRTRDQLMAKNVIPLQVIQQLRLLGDELWHDLIYTAFNLHVDGPKAGPWRTRFEIGGLTVHIYVALDGKVAKVIASQDDLRGLGQHAQRVARDPDAARQLLDWAAEAIAASQAKQAAFRKLWGHGLSRDPKAIALAAAVLAGGGGNLAVLEACSSPVTGARELCDRAIEEVHQAQHSWSALEKHAAVIAGRGRAEDAARHRAMAQLQQRRFDDAAKAVDEVLATSPDDALARMIRVEIFVGRGRMAEAVRMLEGELVTPMGGLLKNNLAWLMLAEHIDLPRALGYARDAAQQMERDTAANTLAAVAAEAEDLQTARTQGVRSMELGRRRMPSDADWLVFATIADKLGLRDDAIAAYKKIAPDVKRDSFSPTSHDIAKARLARLGSK